MEVKRLTKDELRGLANVELLERFRSELFTYSSTAFGSENAAKNAAASANVTTLQEAILARMSS